VLLVVLVLSMTFGFLAADGALAMVRSWGVDRHDSERLVVGGVVAVATSAALLIS
jgi:hypothetical protein